MHKLLVISQAPVDVKDLVTSSLCLHKEALGFQIVHVDIVVVAKISTCKVLACSIEGYGCHSS
jgi:hypothetical protein